MEFNAARVGISNGAELFKLPFVDVGRDEADYGGGVRLTPGRWFAFSEAAFSYLAYRPHGSVAQDYVWNTRNMVKQIKNQAKKTNKLGFFVSATKEVFSGIAVDASIRIGNYPNDQLKQTHTLTLLKGDFCSQLLEKFKGNVDDHGSAVMPAGFEPHQLKDALAEVFRTGANVSIRKRCSSSSCGSNCQHHVNQSSSEELTRAVAKMLHNLRKGINILSDAEDGSAAAGNAQDEVAASQAGLKEALGKFLEDDTVIKEASLLHAQTNKPFQDLLLAACCSRIADRLAVPLEVAQLQRDLNSVSAAAWTSINNSLGSIPSDCCQNPRGGELETYKAELNVVVDKLLKTEVDRSKGSGDKVIFDLKQVMRLQLLTYLAENNPLSAFPDDHELRFKLSFDGTDCGGKSILAFFLVPLSFIKKAQSSVSTMPIAIGWGSETTAALLDYIPHLTQTIAELERDGVNYYGESSEAPAKHFEIRFDIAADMSSLWKSSLIGGASTDENCIYCNCTEKDRQAVGHVKADLENPANRRLHLDGSGTPASLFGLPTHERVHICTLHLLTRVTEKLMKLLVGETLGRRSKRETALASARAGLEQARGAVRRCLATPENMRIGPSLSALRDCVRAREAVVSNASALLASSADEKTIAKSLVDADIGRQFFKIEHSQTRGKNGKGENFSVSTSTLTGIETEKLCGDIREYPSTAVQLEALNSLPIIGVIHAALGDCGHDLQLAEIGANPSACSTCNIRNIFVSWSAFILPVLRAPGTTAVNRASKDNKFDYERFKGLTKNWGSLLNATFRSAQDQSIITPYMHFVVDHAAYFIWNFGALGFWSQQGVEAAHKITKAAYGRASSRDGGRGDADERAPSTLQVMRKAGRIVVGRIRCLLLYDVGVHSLLRRPELLAKVPFSPEEQKLREKCRSNIETRIKRKLMPDTSRRNRRKQKLVGDEDWVTLLDATGPLKSLQQADVEPFVPEAAESSGGIAAVPFIAVREQQLFGSREASEVPMNLAERRSENASEEASAADASIIGDDDDSDGVR